MRSYNFGRLEAEEMHFGPRQMVYKRILEKMLESHQKSRDFSIVFINETKTHEDFKKFKALPACWARRDLKGTVLA